MKRFIRTYLSALLLLCLLVQIAPLSLLHSHEDHPTEVGHSGHEMIDADTHDSEHADFSHETSAEDCHICSVQQSLNNQAYTLAKQLPVFNFTKQSAVLQGLEVSLDNHLVKNSPGRAPPVA